MFRRLGSFYELYIKPIFRHSQAEAEPLEVNSHRRKILDHGHTLRNKPLPLKKKLEAATQIGVLAYTGAPNDPPSPPLPSPYVNVIQPNPFQQPCLVRRTLRLHCGLVASQCAEDYIPDLIEILLLPSISDTDKIIIIQSLCGILYGSYSNQVKAKENHLINLLVNYLTGDKPDQNCNQIVKFWVCYLLNIICCSNIPVIKMLHKSNYVHKSLKVLANMGWYGWSRNYAQILLYVLGFEHPFSPECVKEETEQCSL
ncbi:armadillo-like helical domain-containing protein 2 [Latimeria chalumnae]|uniref:armadillo-like helical domain-containing protein 2 n=1 Tax=Latimeria chalumnae TaxID=7897 RepID=UPI0003C11767